MSSSARARRWGSSVVFIARTSPTPAARADAIPASVSSTTIAFAGATPSSSSAWAYPSGSGLPLATSSELTIARKHSAIPDASTTGSISARAAPEQIASGTRSAAQRTASRTCSCTVQPSATAAR